MRSESMVTCASGPLPNPANVPFFQYKAWWYSIVQKFHNDGKNIQESQFCASMLQWPMAFIRPKSQNFKIGRDGILSIGNFMLMIKKSYILLLQLPGNWPIIKKCAPYFRGNMEFPIYFNLSLNTQKLNCILQNSFFNFFQAWQTVEVCEINKKMLFFVGVEQKHNFETLMTIFRKKLSVKWTICQMIIFRKR
jgi:hypothetical protein